MKDKTYIMGAIVETALGDLGVLYYTGRDFTHAFSDNEKVISFSSLDKVKEEAHRFLQSGIQKVHFILIFEEQLVGRYSKATDVELVLKGNHLPLSIIF